MAQDTFVSMQLGQGALGEDEGKRNSIAFLSYRFIYTRKIQDMLPKKRSLFLPWRTLCCPFR